MIEGMDDIRDKLMKNLKGQPKEVQEVIELSLLVGRAELLSDLCKWGKSEASAGRDISHFSLLAFATNQEKKLRDIKAEVTK